MKSGILAGSGTTVGGATVTLANRFWSLWASCRFHQWKDAMDCLCSRHHAAMVSVLFRCARIALRQNASLSRLMVGAAMVVPPEIVMAVIVWQEVLKTQGGVHRLRTRKSRIQAGPSG